MAQKDPTYSDVEVEQKLKEFPGWWYEDGWIRRTYKTDGWPTTLMLVNAIGYFSEAAYHHPDLSVTWGRVIVKLQNHAAGGITDKDLVLIPGLCEGEGAVLAERVGVRVEKGPKDLRQIPEYFGRAALVREYGAYDIEIVAEVNNAPRLARAALRREAEHYRASGADVIDIGCTPGRAFPELADVVRELVGAGMRVSVDSFDVDEIATAVAAGAELVLSVNQSNLDVARDLAGTKTRVVVIPDLGQGPETLEPSIAALERWGVTYLIDPVIEPIGFGFFASLERFAAVRRRYPTAPLLMGIGNITELTAADTTGVNALLIAICAELGVRAVLTTEVIPWAHGVVREVDIARRLMHHAVRQKSLPKGVDDRLGSPKDPTIFAYPETELRELQARVTH